MLMKPTAAQVEARKIAERMARKMLESRTTESLCQMFEATNHATGCTVEEAMMRGWIMDELEKRDAEAFDRWIACTDIKVMDLPSHFFIAA